LKCRLEEDEGGVPRRNEVDGRKEGRKEGRRVGR
jgi:hypothetical protein